MSDKRVQIIRAAGIVLHARGYAGTTLALVAAEAGLPLGNLYYYFKSKEDLAAAVVDARVRELDAIFAYAEAAGTSPLRRLECFVAAWHDGADELVVHGCPYGALTHDLARRGDALSNKSHALFASQLEWLARQWRALGAGPATAEERAAELVCAIQGACLLGLALHDPEVLRRRLREISRRLADGIVTSNSTEVLT